MLAPATKTCNRAHNLNHIAESIILLPTALLACDDRKRYKTDERATSDSKAKAVRRSGLLALLDEHRSHNRIVFVVRAVRGAKRSSSGIEIAITVEAAIRGGGRLHRWVLGVRASVRAEAVMSSDCRTATAGGHLVHVAVAELKERRAVAQVVVVAVDAGEVPVHLAGPGAARDRELEAAVEADVSHTLVAMLQRERGGIGRSTQAVKMAHA